MIVGEEAAVNRSVLAVGIRILRRIRVKGDSIPKHRPLKILVVEINSSTIRIDIDDTHHAHIFPVGDRTYKLGSGITSEYGRYVKYPGGAP